MILRSSLGVARASNTWDAGGGIRIVRAPRAAVGRTTSKSFHVVASLRQRDGGGEGPTRAESDPVGEAPGASSERVSKPRTGERNIFAEVEAGVGEDEEEALLRRSRLEEQRQAMSQEPAWEGDERVQDTILRMLMDKYQPLRVKGGIDTSNRPAGQHPADVKLATIQQPSPTLGSAKFTAPIGSPPAVADVRKITADLPQPNSEDGRRLARTPEDKPWRAVYVSPLQPKDGQPSTPAVYYGKHLGLPSGGSGHVLPKTAKGKDRLKLAGIKTDSLPVDDTNKMRAIRESVRRWDRAGRMRGVKEEAMDYRRQREEERERGAMSDEELEAALEAEGLDEANDSGVLREGEEMKLTSSSSASPDAKPGDTVIAMSGGRGFNSIANERIEAAMKTDFFKRNKLRGKAMVVDLHASNPFLKGEERIMNRLIQRQGAAPAWVELNGQVESETHDFRRRLADSWLRRSSRMILSSSHLRSGMEPLTAVPEGTSFEALEQSPPLSTGQRRLVHVVAQYTDGEWEARERAYHDAALRDINKLVRKYNVVAPVSARRGVLVREWELQRVRLESRTELVRRLSSDLLPGRSIPRASPAARAGGPGSVAHGQLGHSSSVPLSDGGMAAGRASRTTYGGDGDGAPASSTPADIDASITRPARRRHASSGNTGLGFAELARRTAQRARQLVKW